MTRQHDVDDERYDSHGLVGAAQNVNPPENEPDHRHDSARPSKASARLQPSRRLGKGVDEKLVEDGRKARKDLLGEDLSALCKVRLLLDLDRVVNLTEGIRLRHQPGRSMSADLCEHLRSPL